jgi:hypothetical protein
MKRFYNAAESLAHPQRDALLSPENAFRKRPQVFPYLAAGVRTDHTGSEPHPERSTLGA